LVDFLKSNTAIGEVHVACMTHAIFFLEFQFHLVSSLNGLLILSLISFSTIVQYA